MGLRKYLRLALLGGLISLLLTGCMLSYSVEELYVLPKLPEEYQTLSEQIAAILAGGAEYAAPTAGNNLQSVQLVDLDGDGEEEAVAFFRSNSEEKPLKIYIFRASDEAYQQTSIIEGSGTSIQSIRYVDMDGDGVKEILVSWRVSAEVQALELYSLRDLAAPLVSTAYTRCETADLDDDGFLELVVVRSDGSETGGSAADYYDWDAEGQSLQLRSTAKLSMTVAELQWMQTGALAGGGAAMFLTGVVTGAEETARTVTDILTDQQGELTNIVRSGSTGVSTPPEPPAHRRGRRRGDGRAHAGPAAGDDGGGALLENLLALLQRRRLPGPGDHHLPQPGGQLVPAYPGGMGHPFHRAAGQRQRRRAFHDILQCFRRTAGQGAADHLRPHWDGPGGPGVPGRAGDAPPPGGEHLHPGADGGVQRVAVV